MKNTKINDENFYFPAHSLRWRCGVHRVIFMHGWLVRWSLSNHGKVICYIVNSDFNFVYMANCNCDDGAREVGGGDERV